MFDFDNFREIWSTIKKNKLRTFLTGFAVSWGIFMLITLLGAGNGLRNGIIFNFRRFSANTVEVWGRYTTMPYKGNPTNRRIEIKEADLSGIKMAFPEIEYCSATISQTDTISYGEEYIVGDLRGVSEDYNSIIYINVASQNGRFINKMDMNATRKVIILSPRMAEVLFRNEDPLGKYVKCGNMMYQVVGIYDDDDKSNNAPAYIPFTVAQQLYNKGFGFGSIYFTVNGVSTEEECKDFENRFRSYMARKHIFDPTDKNAIGMWMTGNEIRMFNTMTDGILLFIWIVGIGTLMAGIVGVSNIMLITVRERTREFGIRKAIGAKPASILKLVIVESIMITAIFGYIGMLMGIGLTELIDYGMTMSGMNNASSGGNPGEDLTLFRHPTVSLGISLAATGVLVVAGVLAGYFPARKAVNVSAIEAMRTE